MAKRKALKDLQPSDFPGVDTVRFAKWRAAAAKYEPLAIAVYIGIAILFPLVYLAVRPLRDMPLISKVILLGISVFVALFVPAILITRKPRKLAEEAGITVQAIRAARRSDASRAVETPGAEAPRPGSRPGPVGEFAPSLAPASTKATAMPIRSSANSEPQVGAAAPFVDSQRTSSDPTLLAATPRNRVVCTKCGWRNATGSRACESCRASL